METGTISPFRTKNRHTNFNKDNVLFWSRGQAAHSPLEGLGLSKSVFIFCNVIDHVHRYHLILFMLPCGKWGSGNQSKKR